MSTLSLRIPDSLHKQLRELARRDGISMNQFAATALAEKMSVLMAGEYLEKRAERSSRTQFEEALSRVKDGGVDAHATAQSSGQSGESNGFISDHPLASVAGSAKDQVGWNEFLACIEEGRRRANCEEATD